MKNKKIGKAFDKEDYAEARRLEIEIEAIKAAKGIAGRILSKYKQ